MDPPRASSPLEHFSLRHFAACFDGCRLPAAPLGPSWQVTWDLWERSGGPAKIAWLQLACAPQGAGRRLTVQFRKPAAGGALAIDGWLESAADALWTPQRWELTHQALGPDQRPLPETALQERGELRAGAVHWTVGQRAQVQAVSGPLVAEWGLFGALQQPALTLPSDEFWLLSRGGRTLKPGHRLRLVGQPSLHFGGRRVWREEERKLAAGSVYRPVEVVEDAQTEAFRVYEQLGSGTLPTCWWVSASGHLLAVASGLLCWVRRPTGGTP
ncbi:MAG: hypothetical protein IT204_21265 [Fimbriimonadaceae bacterium]|nr:hypothetical protein [Fimbriimonadaceae bacterium]